MCKKAKTKKNTENIIKQLFFINCTKGIKIFLIKVYFNMKRENYSV